MNNFKQRKRYKKYQANKDYYMGEDKKPSIRKSQRWIVSGILFSEKTEQIGFCSTWVCKRLGTEVYLHKKEVAEIFGIDVLNNIDMRVDVK